MLLRAILLSIVLGPLLPAQPPNADQPPLVLRSTTRLVQISVVVHDRKGQPVADLTQNDFTITEKGKPQQISFFSVESNKALSASQAEKLGAGWHSNQVARREGAPNAVTVILIDALNTRVTDQTYAREQIIRFLAQIRAEDRVAVYLLGRTLHVLHDFTSDSASLVAKMKRLSGDVNYGNNLPPNPADNPTGDPELDKFLEKGFQIESDYTNVNKIVTTFKALQGIAHHLERIPGRKNLLWLSGSFPLQIGMDDLESMHDPTRERRSFLAEAEVAIRAVNQAHLAIYPVDARGLIGLPGFNADALGRPSIGRSDNVRGMAGVTNHDTLNYLADRTGGRAFYNTNDLSGAIRQALDDSTVTYVIGFYPSQQTPDGRFHDIKVNVARSNLDVRYRKGYFALPEAPGNEKESQSLLRDALWSPLDATGIALSGGVLKDDKLPANELRVVLQIDPRSIRLEKRNDRWIGKLTLVYVAIDKEMQQLAVMSHNATFNLLQDRYEKAMNEGLLFGMNLPKAATAEQVRVAVLDLTSGDVGSLRIPVQ